MSTDLKKNTPLNFENLLFNRASSFLRGRFEIIVKGKGGRVV